MAWHRQSPSCRPSYFQRKKKLEMNCCIVFKTPCRLKKAHGPGMAAGLLEVPVEGPAPASLSLRPLLLTFKLTVRRAAVLALLASEPQQRSHDSYGST